MFKTTLVAAIALAGAQAIKISSQATSEANISPYDEYVLTVQLDDGIEGSFGVLTTDQTILFPANESAPCGELWGC